MTCVFAAVARSGDRATTEDCFRALAKAASRLVQPREERFAKKSRDAATLSASANIFWGKAQSQVTSQAARLNVSFGVSDASSAPMKVACVTRWPASIDAEVSARINRCNGSPLGSSGRSQ